MHFPERLSAFVLQVKKLMDKFEFVVAPVINPDGCVRAAGTTLQVKREGKKLPA